MFWVGVGCRWSDYGLTENRVYLIACGLIMTACMGLFLSRRTGRYLYVTLTAIVILALFTYIPGLTPRDIERWSQSGRPAVATFLFFLYLLQTANLQFHLHI